MGSGLTSFRRSLEAYRRITVDTMCCIFQIAPDPSTAQDFARHLFGRARSSNLAVQLPGIVRLELLVYPYRSGDAAELNRVRTLLELTPGVHRMEITEDTLIAAASVRAQTRMKAPDALVVGSAIVNGSDVIVGNDKAFLRLRAMKEVHIMGRSRSYNVPSYIHIDDYLEED